MPIIEKIANYFPRAPYIYDKTVAYGYNKGKIGLLTVQYSVALNFYV